MDALRVDELIGRTLTRVDECPALLMMSGDQIYANDVAGPMLRAIHRVIERLGLYSERLSGATVANSATPGSRDAGVKSCPVTTICSSGAE